MNEKQLTLGSLFDGIGGFPLAAVLSGVTPLWAAEIEPFCIAVTKERFPNMQHLGSVTDINGANIPPVDIITFGSPCQDLSVAGLVSSKSWQNFYQLKFNSIANFSSPLTVAAIKCVSQTH